MTTAKPRPTRSARAARKPAPPLPVLDQLDATHRQVMLTIEKLKVLAEKLEDQGLDEETRGMAAEICTFFDDTARAHHAAEEAHVFPALLNRGDPAVVEHVHRLQQDHGWLEEDWLELQPQLRAVAEGYSWYDIDFLRAAIPVFGDLYRDHIALEEDIVYPASRQLKG